MLKYLLGHSELSGLLHFVSPNLLKVVSIKEVIALANQLRLNSRNDDKWREVLKRKPSFTKENVASKDLVLRGEEILKIFFKQILTSNMWILDFRKENFYPDGGWTPSALYAEVKPSFSNSLRELYQGFYSDDDKRFDAALETLSLTPAKDVLKKHFGVGDQTQVEFKLKNFQTTFTEVFDTCSREKLKLDTDFFVLGLALLTLYENLENLNVKLDVRKSFNASMAESVIP